MSLRVILAVSAALVAAPAMAQTPPPAPPAAAAPTPSPEEVAMQAKGQAFQQSLDALGEELEAVVSDTTKDSATKTTETNAIIERHTPAINAFAADLETFLRTMADKPENADKRDRLLAAANAAPGQIRGIPQQMRATVAESLTAMQQAPAQPAPAQ